MTAGETVEHTDVDGSTGHAAGATPDPDARPGDQTSHSPDSPPGHRAWSIAAVCALTVATAAWRVALALLAGGPTLFGDESSYFDNARSLATLTLYANAHFPPLYPAVISPAFWIDAADPWRPALVISAVVGATTVPAIYWLARTVGARLPVAAAALVAALLGTSAYSQQLLSESLGVPLAVVAVTLALRGRRTPPLLVGVVALLLCSTKYLYLPLALVVIATWWWMHQRGAPPGARLVKPSRSWGLVALPFLVALPAWFAYAVASGSTIALATGADIVHRTSRTGGLETLVGPGTLWLGLYVAYVVVAIVPAVLVASWLAASRGAAGRLVGVLRARVVSRRAALLLVTSVVTVGYVAISVRHSLGALYNLAEPNHYMARYLMHLVPLLAVSAVVGLDLVLERRAAVRGRRLWAGTLATAAIACWAFTALFGSLFDEYDELWGMRISALSPDVFALGTPRFLWVLLGLVVVSSALVAGRRRLPTVLIWIVVAALGTAASFGTYLEGRGGLAHKVGDLVRDQGAGSDHVLVCFGAGIQPPQFAALAFWDVPRESVVILDKEARGGDSTARFASCRAAAGAGPHEPVFYVTSRPGDAAPLLVDDRWGSSMYVFTD